MVTHTTPDTSAAIFEKLTTLVPRQRQLLDSWLVSPHGATALTTNLPAIGLGAGTEMPLDGDGTMVGDKITIALAP